MQRTATHCSTLHHTAEKLREILMYICSVLQRVAACCSVLHTAYQPREDACDTVVCIIGCTCANDTIKRRERGRNHEKVEENAWALNCCIYEWMHMQQYSYKCCGAADLKPIFFCVIKLSADSYELKYAVIYKHIHGNIRELIHLYTYVYTYTCTYAYAYQYTCTHKWTYTYISTCTHACTSAY